MLDEYSIAQRATRNADLRCPQQGILLRGVELLRGRQLPVGCRDAVIGRGLRSTVQNPNFQRE